MLRGSKRAVVEVIDTQNPYFEKAILFVKVQDPPLDDQKLGREADAYLREVKYQPKKKERRLRSVFWKTAKWGSAAAVGATIATLLLKI